MKYLFLILVISIAAVMFKNSKIVSHSIVSQKNQKEQLQVTPHVPHDLKLFPQRGDVTSLPRSQEVELSYEDIESEYKGFSSADLKNELTKIERDLEQGQYIEKANNNSLSDTGRGFLKKQVKKITVLRKILVERSLDEIEREKS